MNNINVKKAYLLALTACLLWSSAFVGMKIGLNYSPPLRLSGIRFILSGLMLLPFCGNLLQHIKNIRTHIKSVFIISFFQTFSLYALFSIAMTLVPGAIGAIIVGASPLVTAIISHLIVKDDKFTTHKFITILFGIAGIIIITLSRQPLTPAGFRECFGIGLLLVGSIASALGNIYAAKTRGKLPAVALNSAQIGVGGFLLFMLSLLFEGRPAVSFQSEFLISLIWLACISASGFSIWFYLLQKDNIKVSELNIWKFTIPVFGALLSWIILPGESPTLPVVAGMSIVAGSVLFFNSP